MPELVVVPYSLKSLKQCTRKFFLEVINSNNNRYQIIVSPVRCVCIVLRCRLDQGCMGWVSYVICVGDQIYVVCSKSIWIDHST